MAAERRGYDARRRRERAEEERRATRRRVLDAAARLFAAQGYTATTIADIAREAGVAVQSVYKAGQSKAELLHAVVDLAVAGDDEDIMIADRAEFAAIDDETDTRRQVHRFADLIASIQERSAPVQAAYRQAAAVPGWSSARTRPARPRGSCWLCPAAAGRAGRWVSPRGRRRCCPPRRSRAAWRCPVE